MNNYLTDTLTKIFKANRDSLSEYKNYYLKFSSKNKLIKITTHEGFDDRKDFNKNRHKIIKAFKQVQIDFVHSKISYWKKLKYVGNTVNISY